MPFDLTEFLTPVLALILWTLIMWIWMFATRLPAMSKAKIDPDSVRHPGLLGDQLPPSVRSAGDNYNHLHEQPTIFYALMFFIAMTGGASQIATYIAWVYVALRVLHSVVQILSGNVTFRFILFVLASFALFALAGIQVMRVFL